MYKVYQDGELIKTTASKTHTITGLTPETAYTFAVSQVIGDKESEKSDPITVTTKAIEPEPIGTAEIGKSLIVI